jgi:2-hydroxy-3-oxopropionate reductase
MTTDVVKPVVGFIGLGIMGKPMARNLIDAGYSLVIHNRSRESVDELAALGARPLVSPRDVAEASEVVITVLPDSPDVETVVIGPDGLIETFRDGQLLVDMSTINPLVSRSLGERLRSKGGSMLDAPVSGGEEGAIQGILSIMVGGEDADVERAQPLFEVMGRTITHMGPLGSGGFTKLANQIIVAINLSAIGEALVFGTRAGVDPTKMIRALSGGMAGSRCLDLKENKILKRDFAPGFKIDLHAKDLGLVHAAAKSLNVPVPTTALVEQFFAAVRRQGFGGDDHSGIVKFFETLAGVEVRESSRQHQAGTSDP